ncbi:TPA: MFS transporter, partial [Clostridioides difficile]|nr:MFS transporter [Clostridioides difficile]
ASLLSGKIAGFTATLGFLQIFGGIATVLIIFGLILLGIRNVLTRLMAMDLLTKEK